MDNLGALDSAEALDSLEALDSGYDSGLNLTRPEKKVMHVV